MGLLEEVVGSTSLEVVKLEYHSTPDQTDQSAHHNMESPRKSPIYQPFLTPREAYELGMRQPKSTWMGKKWLSFVSLVIQSDIVSHFIMIVSKHMYCVLFYCTGGVEVFLRGEGERGVRAKRRINAGEFVLEFEGNLLTREEYQTAEMEYAKENIPVYTLEVSSQYILHITFIHHRHMGWLSIQTNNIMPSEDTSTMWLRAPTSNFSHQLRLGERRGWGLWQHQELSRGRSCFGTMDFGEE